MFNKKLLKYLSNKQREIDDRIFKKYNLNEKNTFERRILAFLIELSEFINEQRDFKYWSKKKSSEKKVLLEEYVDGINFLISIGNTLNVDYNLYDFKYKNDKLVNYNNVSLTSLYLNCFKTYIEFIDFKNDQKYFSILDDYFVLAKLLKFTEKEFMTIYNEKYKINLARQDDDY